MICDKNIDKPEIPSGNVLPLKPIPSEDDKDTGEYFTKKGKCMEVLLRGTELGTPWLTKVKGQKLKQLNFKALEASLEDSNERAWWLRKCCATTAQFNKNTN